MEQQLFSILTNRLTYSSQYILQVCFCIAQFLNYPVKTSFSVGYGKPSLFDVCPLKHPLLKKIESFLHPREYFDHHNDRLSEGDIYAIEQLFHGGVKLRREYFGDNSPISKGYAFRILYSFESIRDVREEAHALLECIVKLLQNNSVKETLEKYQLEKEQREKQLEEEEKKRKAEVKRIYDEEHLPKYRAILQKAESMKIPKKKKDALQVQPDDFEALIYAMKTYSYDDYPSKEARVLSIRFAPDHPILVWMPNDILHCLDEKDNEEYILKYTWDVTLQRVHKKQKELLS
jgi:hypothetical protein